MHIAAFPKWEGAGGALADDHDSARLGYEHHSTGLGYPEPLGNGAQWYLVMTLENTR